VLLATFFAIWRAVASGGGVAEEPAFFTAKGVWGGGVNSESHCWDLHFIGEFAWESEQNGFRVNLWAAFDRQSFDEGYVLVRESS
jgi:hypothetical protein